MLLTVLGCRSGMPADGQPSAGYLVQTPGTSMLLDCGPGVVTALSAVVPVRRLDAVVISHLHTDHCYDLLPLGKALLAGLATMPGGRRRPYRRSARCGFSSRLGWVSCWPAGPGSSR